LWTEPRGNAYTILPHATIATELNQLNGAGMPGDVSAAFNGATTSFSGYTPGEVADLKGNDTIRQHFITYAQILDDYTNGRLGPGHCN
jgi:hypothetical protein